MFFSLSLYASLLVCCLGLAYKVWSWLSANIGQGSAAYSPGQRATAAIRGMLGAIFSPKAGTILKVLLLDGLLQRRSWRVSKLAGAAHLGILAGFVTLVWLHAMGEWLITDLFGEYQATLNPYLFLRNLAGVMVLAGVGVAVYRRLTVPGMRLTTRGVDRLAIALLAVILLSGFGLEGAKVISPHVFDAMVDEYGDPDDEAETKALKAFWSSEYGVVFPGENTWAEGLVAGGKDINEESCAECHAAPQWAFASYGLSRLMKIAAGPLGSVGFMDFLYYLHFLACWLGLAILPFTKFLHLFTSPLLLMINSVSERDKMAGANRATVRALELDACTHCAVCSIHCSVAVAHKLVPNLNILPSEKLASLSAMARGKQLSGNDLRVIREGCYICTSCYRCTKLCPVGINLQDLWFAQKEDLAAAGLIEPYAELAKAADSAATGSRELSLLKVRSDGLQTELKLSAQANSFAECYRCQTCTNACPVVFLYQWPQKELDLLPHQIMHSLGLGMREEAIGARMVWSCLTCYQCQEACPMGVQVTDVLFELRNLAAQGGMGPEA
jgi:heterodisulfide reductase subunit C/nitrate reductase gamma subunit